MSSVAITMDPREAGEPAVHPWIIALALAAFMKALDTSAHCFWQLRAAILGMIPLVFLKRKAHWGGEISVH